MGTLLENNYDPYAYIRPFPSIGLYVKWSFTIRHQCRRLMGRTKSRSLMFRGLTFYESIEPDPGSEVTISSRLINDYCV